MTNTCKCGHAKADHGDDPDRDGYNCCDHEHCPCGSYRAAGGKRPAVPVHPGDAVPATQ